MAEIKRPKTGQNHTEKNYAGPKGTIKPKGTETAWKGSKGT